MSHDLPDGMGLSDEEFNRAFEQAIKFAETVIGREPDGFTPHLFVHYREGQQEPPGYTIPHLAMCCLATDLLSWEDKVKTMHSLARSFYKEHRYPMAIFFIAEALQNRREVGQPLVQPYDDPASKEVVFVAGGRLLDRHCVMATVPLQRGEDGLYRRRA